MFSFYKMKVDEKFFILLNGTQNEFEYSYKLMSEFFCDEKYGIGSNGIIIIEKSEVADFKMKIFDSNGRENCDLNTGIKCLIRYLYEHSDYKKINLETIDGIKELTFELTEENDVSLKMDNTYMRGNVIELFEGKLNI